MFKFFLLVLSWRFFVNVKHAGPHTLSHSLSWTNLRSEVRNGVASTKLWTPDDPRTARANGYYPADT